MTMQNTDAKRRPGLATRLWEHRIDFLFLLPGLLIFGAFIVYPMVASQYFSFLDWSGFDANQVFVGFRNYVELYNDEFFWNAFSRSFLFMLLTVPLQMVISLLFAIMLNNRLLKATSLFRTMIFLPVVTPVAVIGVVMTLMLSPFNGPINNLLLDSGLSSVPVDFLGDPNNVMWTLAGVYVWKWVGVTMVYWLAALQTVPAELFEASKLDGVKGWQVTTFVVLPIIMPFAIVIALISAIGALNVFPLVQSMTAGGPFFASEVMEVYIYRNAFTSTAGAVPRLGYASAAGVFFGVAIMFLTLLQIVAVRYLRNKGGKNG